MIKTVSIVLTNYFGNLEGDVIGVDSGAYYCASKGVEMELACGDFDSVPEGSIEIIKLHAKRAVVLDPIKDITDFSYALTQVDDYDVVYVHGALGMRRDHEYVNVMHCMRDSRIRLVDKNNLIRRYDIGCYQVMKGSYQYFSVIPIDSAIVTLENFKYPLKQRKIKRFDDYLTSNEILGDRGTLVIEEGPILVIQSKDNEKKSA